MVSEQRCHYIGKILAPQRVFLWQQVYLSSASNNNAAKTIITKLCQNSTEVDTGSIYFLCNPRNCDLPSLLFFEINIRGS